MWKKSACKRASEPYATVLAETQFYTEHGHLRPPVTSITEALEDRETGDLELFTAVQLVREHGLAMFCRALFNANEFVYLY